MIYVFLMGIVVVGTAVYLAIMYTAIPGAVEERLGAYEQLPGPLDVWMEDPANASQDPAVTREVRYLLERGKGLFSGEQLVKQSRLRHRESGEIIEVLAEERMKRRRKPS